MTRIIAIANQKGGVGKTTTAVNLAAAVAVAGHRTLLVDMDPQGNAGSGLGIDGRQLELDIYHGLTGRAEAAQLVINTLVAGLDLLPSTQSLSGLEVELVGMQGRSYTLKKLLGALAADYDFIFIDAPPSLGLLTVNVLCAARTVLIPIQCEYYALEGLGQLLNVVNRIQQGLNAGLSIEGILLTMFDRRLNLSRQVAAEALRFFDDKVYKTVIPRNVKLSEAPSFGKPAILYDVESAGSQSYIQLAQEVIHAEKSIGAGA